ncbi:hypothetical protein HDV00_008689 [Rhizophlyctis rosea]|nr:hypothetical protein HDV00_008689 [Rhizophlyctis rosea]
MPVTLPPVRPPAPGWAGERFTEGALLRESGEGRGIEGGLAGGGGARRGDDVGGGRLTGDAGALQAFGVFS